MPLDEPAWLLVHELRVRGRVDTPDLDELAVEQVVGAGFAQTTARGLVLTPIGREEHRSWVRIESGSPEEERLQLAHQAFLPLNRELLVLCHDWQVHPDGSPNDHRRSEYDWAVLDRLHAFDERAGGVVRRTARAAPRFHRYRDQLTVALERVDAGEHEWFTSPRIDSYHTVWMVLHEDLLLTLGVERADEAPADA